jgi:hypothetical protein
VGGHGELGLAVTAKGVELVQAEVLARGCTDGDMSDERAECEQLYRSRARDPA